jgi:rubrerythrin
LQSAIIDKGNDVNSTETEKIFDIAIGREIEANRFYAVAAKKMRDASVRALFSELALEEYGHMEILEKYRHDPALEMKIPSPSVDYKIAEATETHKLSFDAKPADALSLAMKKEQMAVELYRSLAASAADPGLREVLANLANMELSHKQKLETMFVNVGYPEVF